MTTIAYRDGVLAADTLATSNGLRDSIQHKIWRNGRILVGAAGSVSLCQSFRSWVVDGMTGDSPFKGKDDGNGLVVSRHGIICFDSFGPCQIHAPFYALGTGYQIAMGSMQRGATAEQAVSDAIVWDICSGGKVDVLRLDD